MNRRLTRPGRFRAAAIVGHAALALTLFGSMVTGVAAQDATPTTSAFAPDAAEGMTFGLIQKSGDQEYFIDEARGFRDTIEAAGGDVIVQDVQLDASAAMNAVDTMISAGVNGIAIVVPDQKIGPAVIEKAQAANIPLIALDDVIADADGKDAPFAGFDGTDMGTKVGEEAAKLWTESGWGSDGVGVLSLEVEALSVCNQRTDAARKMMTEAGFPAANILKVPYDGTAPKAIDAASTVITAHPEFTKWVVWACNDEGVQGALRALESAGVTADNVIGVGLGAYLACPEWKSGNPTGFKAALYISGVDVGISGAEALLGAAINGTPLPEKAIAKTTMTTPENYQDSGLSC